MVDEWMLDAMLDKAERIAASLERIALVLEAGPGAELSPYNEWLDRVAETGRMAIRATRAARAREE